MKRIIPTLLVTLLLTFDAASSSLLNYENRVVRAAEQIERIKTDSDYAEEGVSYIKRLLPRSERVEFEGREVLVDNTWLYVLLDSYAADNDPQQRVARLNETAGCLRALDDHLRRAQAGGARDAADPQDKVREILSRPAYRTQEDTAALAFIKKILQKVRAFRDEVLSALQRLIERLFGAGSNAGWISYVLLAALIAIALLVIARLAARLRVPRSQRKKTRIILGEEIAAGDTSRELAEAGLAAARAGDFRAAVRKLYVSLLYEFAERNLIELEDSATNHEYLNKVSRFGALAGPMRYLTERFDYVWYGMFPSSEPDFMIYHARYAEAMETARRLAGN